MTQKVGLESLVRVHTPRATVFDGAPLLYCVVCSPVEHAGKLEGVTWPCPPLVEAGWPAPHTLCPNVSFYSRPCTLPPHGWQQPCVFGPDPDPEENLAYDLENGSTLRDLLEAFSAGGPIAIMAAMRWVEYRLYRDARDAAEHVGGIVAQVRDGAVIAAKTEQDNVQQYLEQRLSVTGGAVPGGQRDTRADDPELMRLALRDANRLLYSLGQGPFLPGEGQLPFPTVGG